MSDEVEHDGTDGEARTSDHEDAAPDSESESLEDDDEEEDDDEDENSVIDDSGSEYAQS